MVPVEAFSRNDASSGMTHAPTCIEDGIKLTSHALSAAARDSHGPAPICRSTHSPVLLPFLLLLTAFPVRWSALGARFSFNSR